MFEDQSGKLNDMLARLEALEARIGELSDEFSNLTAANTSNLLDISNDMAMRIWRVEQAVMLGADENRLIVEDRLNRARLAERQLHWALSGHHIASDDLPKLSRKHVLSLQAQWRALNSAAPLNFNTYQRAFVTGAKSYEGLPQTSCSTDRHREAGEFRDFLRPYLTGSILDIGCGPQAMPFYLDGADPSHIWGIDPLPAAEPHPFSFYQGFGEFLPFADDSFDLAVSATTIDHYYLLDKGIAEARRVLKPKGVFTVWIALIQDAPEYDPYSAMVHPIDAEHLFHINPDWFLPLMEKSGFSLLERMVFSEPFRYGFFAFTKTGG